MRNILKASFKKSVSLVLALALIISGITFGGRDAAAATDIVYDGTEDMKTELNGTTDWPAYGGAPGWGYGRLAGAGNPELTWDDAEGLLVYNRQNSWDSVDVCLGGLPDGFYVLEVTGKTTDGGDIEIRDADDPYAFLTAGASGDMVSFRFSVKNGMYRGQNRLRIQNSELGDYYISKIIIKTAEPLDNKTVDYYTAPVWDFDYASPFGSYGLDGLAVIYKNGKCGLMNPNLQIVLPIEYDWFEGFGRNGIADMAVAWKDGKAGLIGKDGRIVIKAEYDWIAPWGNNLLRVGKKIGGIYSVGLINLKGEVVLPLEYDWVGDPAWGIGGYARISKGNYPNELFGLIDANGNVKLEAKYGWIPDFDENGTGIAVLSTQNPSNHDEYSQVLFSAANGLIVDESRYEWIGEFRDGLAWVKSNATGLEGYIDRSGKEVIPCIYNDASVFSDGIARVYINGLGSFYIDTNGNDLNIGIFSDYSTFYNENGGLYAWVKNDAGAEYYKAIYGEVWDAAASAPLTEEEYNWIMWHSWYKIDINGNQCGLLGSSLIQELVAAQVHYLRIDGGAQDGWTPICTMIANYPQEICSYISTDGGRLLLDINANGYNYVRNFKNGWAEVMRLAPEANLNIPYWAKENEQHRRFGIIDTSGNVVLDVAYNRGIDYGEGLNSNGLGRYGTRPADTAGYELSGLIDWNTPRFILKYDVNDPTTGYSSIWWYADEPDGFIFISQIVGNSEKRGIATRDGTIIIPPVFDYAYQWNEAGGILRTEDFHKYDEYGNELWVCGLMDKQGKEILKPEWNYIYKRGEFDSLVIFGKYNLNEMGLYNFKTGAVNYYDDIWEGDYDAATNTFRAVKNGKWGLLNKDGGIVIPFDYEHIENFSEGLAVVAFEKNGDILYGYIDINNKTVIETKYYDARNFSQGLAPVFDGAWGYIDKTDAAVIPKMFSAAEPFSDGAALVANNILDAQTGQWEYRYSFINTYGDIVSADYYEYAQSLSGGLAWYTQNGKWGLLRYTNNHNIAPPDTDTGAWTPAAPDGGSPPAAAARPGTETESALITTRLTAADIKDGAATVAIIAKDIASVLEGLTDEDELITIKVELQGNVNPDDITSVDVKIPGGAFAQIGEADINLAVETPIADLIFDSKSIDAITAQGGGEVVITAAIMDNSELPPHMQELVGDRPVYDFTVTVGGKEVTDFKGGRVQVSIPYTLQPGENPNAILVRYLSDDGTLHLVRGRYDAKTGTVIFVTTHFSKFIIDYNPVAFTDIIGWYKDAIIFIAARDYHLYAEGDKFEPKKKLTRGEFTATLMRAYGITPDPKATDNFNDVDENALYAPYLATAKKQGLAYGVGGNMFAPEQTITREEMFALLHRALVIIGEAPNPAISGKTLGDFNDGGDISAWAVPEIEALLAAGMIDGVGGRLFDPKRVSDRATMAQMIYNLQTR